MRRAGNIIDGLNAQTIKSELVLSSLDTTETCHESSKSSDSDHRYHGAIVPSVLPTPFLGALGYQLATIEFQDTPTVQPCEREFLNVEEDPPQKSGMCEKRTVHVTKSCSVSVL